LSGAPAWQPGGAGAHLKFCILDKKAGRGWHHLGYAICLL
jgi:hypothetical protein